MGFVRDTLEKVYRLADVLRFMENDGVLAENLALKGGTAINLTIFDLPRLSVDIDLDYSGSIDREEMLLERPVITERIKKYMAMNGYSLSAKTKTYHALDSFVFEYVNAGGNKDNLKVEINYMLRSHVLPLERRMVNLPWSQERLTVYSVSPIEVFAAKTVALLSRTAPRDLYDMYNLAKCNMFNDEEKDMLRKCAVYYSAIAAERAPESFKLDNIGNLLALQIRRDLEPVLRHGEKFELNIAKQTVREYLSGILHPTAHEVDFWRQFNEGRYCPELIFKHAPEYENVKEHPMALWKCRNNAIAPIRCNQTVHPRQSMPQKPQRSGPKL